MFLFISRPSGDPEKFLTYVYKFLAFASEGRSSTVIAGDHNINTLKPSNTNHQLNYTITSNGFTNLIATPTRITPTSCSASDLSIVDIASPVISAVTIACYVSVHCAVFYPYHYICPTSYAQTNGFVYQCINDVTLARFRECVRVADRYYVLTCSSVHSYELFLNTFK